MSTILIHLEKEITKTKHQFLQGGGEMGELTREYDWANTPIGEPDKWPQSLRTTVAMILNSKFPMFLWWGEDLIQFYNDAYRPSLGNEGKHPTALGQKGKDCWPEIWAVIYPLIKQVRETGEATWSEDQLIPIYRNGKLEDVYWTFGYSPIRGETEEIEGVLVVCNETTEKVQNNQKLEQSEKRFQNLIREATVGIVVLTGQDMVVEVVNESYGKLIDRKPEELIGKKLFEIIPETGPYFRKMMEGVRDTGKPVFLYDHPYFVYSKGEKIEGYLNIIYQPYREEDGRTTGVMALCHDVTEQVLSKNRLQISEERTKSLVESAPFPIGVYIGKDMVIELANQAILDVWGKGNDVIGKKYSDILPELENQKIFDQLESVYTTGMPFHAKNQRVDLVVDNKMRIYYFNYSFTPLYNSHGDIYGVMNTAADVTDLVKIKTQLEKSEDNLKNTILQAPVAMCRLRGANHLVEIANIRMLELWGKTGEEIINKPLFEGLPEAKDQGFEAMLDNVYQNGATEIAQAVPVTLPRNGTLEVVYVNFVYEAYHEPDGSVSGIMVVASDVTAQVIAKNKIEEVVAKRTKELADTNSDLQRSNAELAQFAYIASHDLQEPLRKISTYTQMLENQLENIDDKSRNYFNKITSASSRMNKLIRDVLTYSELVRENDVFEKVDLNKIADAITNDFELLIEQKQAVIKYHDLPVIEAIPLQMSQLFSNMLSNALKFSKPGVKPVITISSKQLSSNEVKLIPDLDPKKLYYKIVFKDNGIGFRSEHGEQIFNIFQRLHRKSEYEGTGIGLAMCKKIAKNHNGDVNADGTSDKGAIFNIILPATHVSIKK
ncbi:MAG: rcsC [Bacteroidetes bacterium]|jgi:PAS domain S-box-containing protein|nr:rcsC [Bacteroidota bacterium]